MRKPKWLTNLGMQGYHKEEHGGSSYKIRDGFHGVMAKDGKVYEVRPGYKLVDLGDGWVTSVADLRSVQLGSYTGGRTPLSKVHRDTITLGSASDYSSKE